MGKRFLIIPIVAAFAAMSLASAAALVGVTDASPDIAAGNDVVSACGDVDSISYTTSFNGTSSQYEVDAAVVTLVGGNTCTSVEVTLTGSNSLDPAVSVAGVAVGDVYTASFTDIAVADLEDIHILAQ